MPFAHSLFGVATPHAMFLIFLSVFFRWCSPPWLPLELFAGIFPRRSELRTAPIRETHPRDASGYHASGNHHTSRDGGSRVVSRRRRRMIAGRDGLGFAVMDARNGLRTDLLVVEMIVIGIIGSLSIAFWCN